MNVGCADGVVVAVDPEIRSGYPVQVLQKQLAVGEYVAIVTMKSMHKTKIARKIQMKNRMQMQYLDCPSTVLLIGVL